MAVFLHFGKEISDMMVKHISIEVTSKQTKKPVFGGPADLTAYILEPVDGILDKKRPAVLLCPGGGYRTLSTREDQPIAMKYLAAGFHVFVLHYSLAPDVFPRALMELALAMKVIREHGDEWNVDVDRIAVSGFSAGGHLACCLGVFWDREWLYGALGVKPEMIRPDGMILCYPVITSGEYCHKGSFECLMGAEASKKDEKLRRLLSLEYQVGPQVPKTFFMAYLDGPVSAGREQPVAFTGFKKGRSKCGGAFVSGGASWDRAWDRRNPGNRSEISGALL